MNPDVEKHLVAAAALMGRGDIRFAPVSDGMAKNAADWSPRPHWVKVVDWDGSEMLCEIHLNDGPERPKS